MNKRVESYTLFPAFQYVKLSVKLQHVMQYQQLTVLTERSFSRGAKRSQRRASTGIVDSNPDRDMNILYASEVRQGLMKRKT
jgi:hypothetical protein